MVQITSQLPLPLDKKIATPKASQLPLTLDRPLGTLTLPDPVDDITYVVSSCFAVQYNPSATVNRLLHAKGKALPVSNIRGFDFGVGIVVKNCLAVQDNALPSIVSDAHINVGVAENIKSCSKVTNQPLSLLMNKGDINYNKPELLKSCRDTKSTPTLSLRTDNDVVYTPAVLLKQCKKAVTSASSLLVKNSNVNYQKGVRPACEWVFIPAPDEPEPFDPNPCGIRPSSLNLPLSLSRRAENNSLMLPLPLACSYKTTIPLLSTYMIFNTITATIDGLPVELFEPSIKTSMDAFCWQFSAEISYDDFNTHNIKLRKATPTLSVVINGDRWDFDIETYDDSQAFIANRASISGRSQTSQLSGSDVMRTPTLLLQSLNARQIIDKQLEFLPFTLSDYDAADWLVPGGTYTQIGSPMDTILDVATAGGNFVASHPYEKTLEIKRRWSVAAWQMKDRAATLTIPTDVILSIDSNKNDDMKYNSIYVIGSSQNSKGGKVYRELSNQVPEASTVKHELYTDVTVLRDAGIAKLSDSGEHTIYAIKTIVSSDYNVRLAEVGEICEITGANGKIKGVVIGVSIECEIDNDAQTVEQMIHLDYYAGD